MNKSHCTAAKSPLSNGHFSPPNASNSPHRRSIVGSVVDKNIPDHEVLSVGQHEPFFHPPPKCCSSHNLLSVQALGFDHGAVDTK